MSKLKKLPRNLFWTDSDKKLIYRIIEESESITGQKCSFNINDLLTYNNTSVILKIASEKVGRRGCNDLPSDIDNILSAKEWQTLRVEFDHYNNSLDEIKESNHYYFMDYMIFFFYATKLEFMKTNGSNFGAS